MGMKLTATFILIGISLCRAQDRPAVLTPTNAEIRLSVSSLAEARHKWPMMPEKQAPLVPNTSPAPTLSAAAANQLTAAMGRLVPSGRMLWDGRLRLYVAEFRRLEAVVLERSLHVEKPAEPAQEDF